MSDEFLELEEIAKQMHVTTETVRVWIREKQLIAYKIGRSYLVKKEDFQKFLELRRTDTEK
jgi:excisionase family DNA binding protein